MRTSRPYSEIDPASAMLEMIQVRNDHTQVSREVNSSLRSPNVSRLGRRNNGLFNPPAISPSNPQPLTTTPHSRLCQLLQRQMAMKSLPQVSMCQ